MCTVPADWPVCKSGPATAVVAGPRSTGRPSTAHAKCNFSDLLGDDRVDGAELRHPRAFEVEEGLL